MAKEETQLVTENEEGTNISTELITQDGHKNTPTLQTFPNVIAMEILKATLNHRTAKDHLKVTGETIALGLTCRKFYIILKEALPKPIRLWFASQWRPVAEFIAADYRLSALLGSHEFKRPEIFLRQEVYGSGAPATVYATYDTAEWDLYQRYREYDEVRNKQWGWPAELHWCVPNPRGMGADWYYEVKRRLTSDRRKTLGVLLDPHPVWGSIRDGDRENRLLKHAAEAIEHISQVNSTGENDGLAIGWHRDWMLQLEASGRCRCLWCRDESYWS